MLMGLANKVMRSHSAPMEQEVKDAHEFADLALQLALEGLLLQTLLINYYSW